MTSSEACPHALQSVIQNHFKGYKGVFHFSTLPSLLQTFGINDPGLHFQHYTLRKNKPVAGFTRTPTGQRN